MLTSNCQWINVNKTNHAIRWLYPVDSVIQPLNDWGLATRVRYITLSSKIVTSAFLSVTSTNSNRFPLFADVREEELMRNTSCETTSVVNKKKIVRFLVI